MSSLKRILSLVVVFAMLLSVSVFADGPETPDEGEPAAVETASETAATVDLPAADAAIETAAEAVETANEVLETLEAIAPETTEETDTSGEAIEAAAEAGDLDALAAIVEAAAESAKADAETAKAAAETTQTAADALQEQVETGTFEYISDETEFDAVDEESGETYETTTGQALVETAQAAANAATAAAQNAETASENAANAADAAQYALENSDEPATEEQQQIVDTAKEAAADAAEKSETAKAAAAEVEAVIETATATAEEAAVIVAKAADAAKDAADAANKAAEAAQDAANTIAIIRNVDETHTEDEVDAAKAVVVEKVERAVELAKVADEKAVIAKEAAERAKDVTLSGEEKAQAIATAAKAAKEATIAANEAADAANEAADAAWELAEQKGWPFYQKVVTKKGVIVTARAQAGVFPKDTVLTAEDVEPEQVEEQMDVAAADVVTAVDINFYLGEAKIQPDTSKGLVDVTITDPNAKAVPTAVKTVKDGETETLAVEVEDGVAMFEAEHFTTYATVDQSAGVARVEVSKVASGSVNADATKVTVGGVEYYYFNSLADAVGAADNGATVTLIKNANGAGIFLAKADCKTVTIDLGGFTFTCSGPAVGSAGTQSQAFHLEKGNTVTLQNGTISSTTGSGVKMLVQNYCNLTLSDVKLDGQNIGSGQYTLSNNCGVVAINAGTVIDAPSNGFVFDACVTNYYPDGTQITVNGGTFNGKVEYGVWGTIPTNNKVSLTIKGGVFNGAFAVDDRLATGIAEHISITGGTFSDPNALKYLGDNADVKIKLTADKTVSGLLTIDKAAKVELDLGGKQLTACFDLYQGELTVKNGTLYSSYCPVWVNGSTDQNLSAGGYNKLAIASDATVKGEYAVIDCPASSKGYGSEIDVDGTIEGWLWVLGTITQGNSVVNVNSTGHLKGQLQMAGYCIANVKAGAQIDGTECGIEVRAGVLNVYGGTIKTPYTGEFTCVANSSGSTTTGAGIAVAQHTTKLNIQVNISDGDITGLAGLAIANPQGNDTNDALNVTITGGTFTATGDGVDTLAVANKDSRFGLSVTGGTFSSDPTVYVNATTHSVLPLANNNYMVVAGAPENVADKAATCTEAGNKAYSTTGGKYFTVADGKYTEISEADTVITKLGHTWGDPVWSWNGYNAATATRTCQNDSGHVETANATIISEVTTTANYDRAGVRTYTATVVFNGTTYTDTRTEAIPQWEYSDDSGDDSPATTTPTQTQQETTTIEEEATPLAALPESLSEVTVAVTNEAGETVEVAVSELPNVYADVEDDSWSRDAIAYANALGLMNGVGADENGEASFNPQGTTTSEMLTTVLYRATSGETTSGENWAEDAIAWAADANLTEGLGLVEGEAVTREQMVTMMYRVAEARGFDVTATTDLTGYTDADKMSEFARAAMEWAVSIGLINGTDVDKLSPDAEVTREQIATILMRFNEMTKDLV